ncbi:MAG: hypothetical protein LC808_43365 [Actinobacteria bacterium]|nr:hypothetical protein [Actinomycetota bacterium]
MECQRDYDRIRLGPGFSDRLSAGNPRQHAHLLGQRDDPLLDAARGAGQVTAVYLALTKRLRVNV